MIDDAADDALDALLSCQCCLQRGQQRSLKTPYIHQGKTETYSDMLQKCFDIRINVDSKKTGICLVCVGRLREASGFKQQVQRSQRELRRRLTGSTGMLEGDPASAVKWETADEDKMVDLPVFLAICEEHDVKSEPEESGEDAESDYSLVVEESALELKLERGEHVEAAARNSWSDEDISKSETGEQDGATPSRSLSSLVRAQLAMACCVRLETCRVSSVTHTQQTLHTQHTPHTPHTLHTQDTQHTQDTLHTRDDAPADACDPRGLLKKHTPRSRTTRKLYHCNMCNKSFCHKGAMQNHVKIVHEGEKRHCCEICGKRFKRNCDLKRHFQVHTGEKPFRCDICDKRFSQTANLKQHVNIHRGQTKHRSFECDTCSKRFTQKGALIVHLRVHSGLKPYTCEICERRFADSSTFIVHVKLHTGEKPFSCDICKKHFTQKKNVIKHMRIHTR